MDENHEMQNNSITYLFSIGPRRNLGWVAQTLASNGPVVLLGILNPTEKARFGIV
jgi:hypothetical protein